jgi:hypothetical protein
MGHSLKEISVSPNNPELQRKASLLVAHKAKDLEDAANLLKSLGLMDDPLTKWSLDIAADRRVRA